MKILGVDPGTNILGYALIDTESPAIRVLDIGTIKLDKKSDHQNRLREIYLQLQEVIETFLPGCMAIEAPFYGKDAQAMLKLGRAQGVAIAAAITMGVQVSEYSPRRIKKSVTGNGNATKEQVAAMLGNLLKHPVRDAGLDASDALAAAYCHHLTISGVNIPATGSKGGWNKFIRENPGRLG